MASNMKELGVPIESWKCVPKKHKFIYLPNDRTYNDFPELTSPWPL
jgi:hypothetical protein